eukprot:m51a1_g8419 hypothetical protein (1200) ;mRNA; f:309957-315390
MSFLLAPRLFRVAGSVVLVLSLASEAWSSSACSATGLWDCVANTSCGWCTTRTGAGRCMEGGRAAPSACSPVPPGTWQHRHSQVYDTVAGFPVSPALTRVFLESGDPLNVTVSVYIPKVDDQALDIMFIQDTTVSMVPSLNTVSLTLPRIITSIIAARRETFFGLAEFQDKPCYPAALKDQHPALATYRLRYAIQANYSGMQNTFRHLTTTGNYDDNESSYDAMMYASCSQTGWRQNSIKIYVIVSDAAPKAAGSVPQYTVANGFQKPFSIPDPNDCSIPFNYVLYQPYCGMDYPSEAQVRDMLLRKNIFPVATIAPNLENNDVNGKPMNATAVWEDLLRRWGFGFTFLMDQDSANIVDGILKGIDFLTSRVQLVTLDDPYSYVQGISPSLYTSVKTQQTYPFTDCTIVLTAIGWGQATIEVVSVFPGWGCDKTPGSDAIPDLCGICGGSNDCVDCSGVVGGPLRYDVCGNCGSASSAATCLDCDSVPWGPARLDVCGVCGGDGSTCTGCDGRQTLPMAVRDLCGVCNGNNSCLDCSNTPGGTLVVDQCGVCDGNNSCVGCDGVPADPPRTYDTCGVCSGDGTTCFDCAGVPNGPAKYDSCHVCNGKDQCVGCDSLPGFPPAAYDQCGVCKGNNSCLGCDLVPFSGLEFDVCGVCGGKGECKGCDGVPRSGLYYDSCGVCNGTNECVGCDGVRWSNRSLDDCFVCGGSNKCYGCDGGRFSGKSYDDCGICGGDGTSCLGCDGNKWSGLKFDKCGICAGHDDLCLGCDGSPWSRLEFDDCNICGGNNTCLGCDGLPWSGLDYDECGVCGGISDCYDCEGEASSNAFASARIRGCDGVPNSGLLYDQCGECDGHDACVECGEPWAKMDRCGICGGNNSCIGCDGQPSFRMVDECGVCGGNNDCFDCFGVKWGKAVVDNCSQCGGNNSCFGCDGLPYFTTYDSARCGVCGGHDDCIGCDGVRWGKELDKCGICGGNDLCVGCDGGLNFLQKDRCGVCGGNDSCIGCDGQPNGSCGVCGGKGVDCLGCDGLPWGKEVDICGICGGDGSSCRTLDKCGSCGGSNSCVGCDGVAHLDKPPTGYDLCGECGGNNTCYGCDGLQWSRKAADACGVCGGNQTDSQKCSNTVTVVKTAAIAAGAFIGVVLGAVCAGVAGFFIYKRWANGANWFIPNALRNDDEAGTIVNPVYEQGQSAFQDNVTYEPTS